jgi:hypothetical protein
MRLRAVSVSNDDLEAYLDEARRTQIKYSYIAQDDDDSATLMINEYESLLSDYKDEKRKLMQRLKTARELKSARGRNASSLTSKDDETDDTKLIERLEEVLRHAEDMIKKSITD